MKTTNYVLAIVLCTLLCGNAYATHIMGGNLYYQYLNTSNGKVDYLVTLKMYRLCDPGSSQLPDSMKLGVYKHDINAPNANKILYANYAAELISAQFIVPPNGNDTCNFAPSVCIEEGVYQVYISVDTSAHGYHLIMDRCCRNGNIINLFNPLDEGQAYHAYIPPTNIINSSPTFAVAPVPYLCVGDTVSVLNAAFDGDGDLLKYHFVWPYGGISSGNNSNPTMPLVYSWPIDTVTYDQGFSVAQPFGATGYSNIDTLTGLTKYLATIPGFYVVAVEISEYRNGVLIGISRRDLQLIFITCPANPAPVLSSNTPQTNFTIEEGQNLCFTPEFIDINGDSVYMYPQGNIFNSALVNPAATMNADSAIGVVSQQFCWTPSCLQGTVVPYNFNIIVRDNGCPPKTTNYVFTINVTPFISAPIISGPDTLCANVLNGVVYTVSGNNGSTFNWSVNGGNIVNGNGTNTITVNWNAGVSHTVTVMETSAYGCNGAPFNKNIYIKPLPQANAGSDVTYCSGNSAGIGATTVQGVSYSWSPGAGLNSATISNPISSFTNTTQLPINYTVILTTTLDGCANTDTVTVTVNPVAISNAGQSQNLCSGKSLTLGTSSTNGYTYAWSPSNGLSATNVAAPSLNLTNNTSNPYQAVYTVTTNNAYGCSSSDSVTIMVYPLPTIGSTANPDTICFGTNATLLASGGNTYTWANILTPNNTIATTASITVWPTVTSTYIVTGTSAVGCENTSLITVVVNPLPAIAAIANPDSICEGDSVLLIASGGNTYSWAMSQNPNNPISNNNSIWVSPLVSTTYILTGIDTSTCINKDSITITVNPAPTLTAIGGTTSVCPGITGLTYFVINGNSNSTYQWTISGGTIVSGQGNDSIVVNWGATGIGIITVVETTDKGCISEMVGLSIIINPQLQPQLPIGDTIMCANEAQNILYTTINTPGSTYTWYTTGGNIVNGQGTNTVTVSWNTPGPATVYLWYDENTVADTICFGTSDSIAIALLPVPLTSPITGANELCVFDTANYSVTNNVGSTYQWFISNGSILSGNGTHTITASFNAWSNEWLAVMETNSFGCVGDTVFYYPTVNPLPIASAGNDASMCADKSVQLQASGGVAYTWLPPTGLSAYSVSNPIATPIATTTYTVMVTDSNGCKNSDSIIITVNPLPNAQCYSAPAAICIGDTALFTAVGGSYYLWTPNIAIQDTTAATTPAFPISTTTYTVTVTDANTCSATTSLTLIVNPLPNITVSNNTLICNGQTTTLIAGGASTYTWQPSSGLSNTSIGIVVAAPSATTTYTVFGTDTNGCENMNTLTVDVNPQPTALFTIATEVSCSGVLANFTNQSSDALQYEWWLANGITTTDVNASQFYNFGQAATITLIAINGICTDTFSLSNNVVALAAYVDSMPNVFTPNNDGINDCYEMPANFKFVDCYSLSIYNRWGNLVYDNTTANAGCWDGRNQQKELCPAGVYYGIIKIKDIKISKPIQLLR